MRATLAEILNVHEEMAPLSLSADYDNSGLQCGDLSSPVSRILLCLDCSMAVVEEAKDRGCEMILSHHPLIFPAIRSLCAQDGVGAILRELVRSDIALVSMHTNLDVAKNGVSDALAQVFGVGDGDIVEPAGGGDIGYGRVGDIEPIALARLAAFAKQALSAQTVRFIGQGDRVITRLAVLCGSGSAAFDAARTLGAQCAITGDVKYGAGWEAHLKNLAVIDAGHYDTEKVIFIPWQTHLQKRLNALKYDVDLMITSKGADIFTRV
jgi:dinuclear metal center YbgI/SA1388 family protein